MTLETLTLSYTLLCMTGAVAVWLIGRTNWRD